MKKAIGVMIFTEMYILGDVIIKTIVIVNSKNRL